MRRLVVLLLGAGLLLPTAPALGRRRAEVPPGETTDLPAAVQGLRAQDWRVPDGLPGGFRRGQVGGRPVQVRSGSPERVVWSGGGTVRTLVSDAPAGVVRDAVATLPRDRPERDGVLARLGRGLRRLASVLSPSS